MSFESVETSEYGNEPRELFWFMRGSESWTYTSAHYPIDFSGYRFEPMDGIVRTSVRDSGERSRNQMTVTVPRDSDIARMLVGVPETKPLWLHIYRVHDGEIDYTILWQGRVRFGETSGSVTKITLDDIRASTKKAALRHLFQNQCNNFTFDANCGLSEADFSTDVTVVSVVGNVLSVTDSQAAGYYTAGQVLRANGDRRFVVNDTFSSGVHALELISPFENIAAGETVTVIGGACRHTFSTCQIVKKADGSTVDNSANYGGYPKVPTKNPFRSFH